MSFDWAEKNAEEILSRGFIQSGICLLLGAVDTGKTSLIKAMAERLAENQPVGIVDADIGQSHIGPPTTVGWAVVDNPQIDFAKLNARAISFVGDVTPAGHLLQLTAGIIQCVEQAAKVSRIILIDTPGFVKGPAACALWWTIQKILQSRVIIAAQRANELNEVLAGLKSLNFQREFISVPQDIPLKSMQDRQNYRQQKFCEYFHGSETHKINLSEIALQTSGFSGYGDIVGKLVGLRDAIGKDLAVGVVLEHKENVVVIKTPPVNIEQVRCVVIGDATIDLDI